MKVTIFENFAATKNPFHVSLEKVIDRIRTGSKALPIINQLRTETDEKKRKDIKRLLPCILFSGVFLQRLDNALIEHSGLLILDIDDVEQAASLRDSFREYSFVVAAFISPSGNGVKVLVRIPASAKQHRGHFEALRKLFPEIDSTGINESRICYESYDPDIYYNPDADEFTDYIMPDEPALKLPTQPVSKATGYDCLNTAVDMIRKAEDGSKHDVLLRAARLAGGFVGAGRIDQQVAFDLLLQEIQAKPNVDNLLGAKKTIQDGLDYGKRNPIYEGTTTVNPDNDRPVPKTSSTHSVIFLSSKWGDMQRQFREGKARGETTHFADFDRRWTWKRGETTVFSGVPGAGKALALDTPIPTPDGWTTMGELKVGDMVFDEQGRPCRVTNATEVMYNHKCYAMQFTDGSIIICDEDHNWFTSDHKARKSAESSRKKRPIGRPLKPKGKDQTHLKTYSSVKTTKQIAESIYAEKGKRLNHNVPNTLPLQLPEISLPIPPYTLGAWLGDGTSDCGSITCLDREVLTNIQNDGFKITDRKNKINHGILGLKARLSNAGILGDKRIPSVYFRASYEQRLSLLQGMMDTDGHANDNRECEFCTTKKVLADGFYELAVSVGLIPKIKEGRAKLYGKDCGPKYRVFFTPHPEIAVFRLSRKLEKINKPISRCRTKCRYIESCKPVDSVPVRCITVDSPSHLYLCGKAMIPTHNTEWVIQLMSLKALYSDWRFAVFCPENFPADEFYDSIIHVLVGKSVDPRHSNQMTAHEYEKAAQFVQEHFYYIYPETMHTLGEIEANFEYAITALGCDATLIDPYNQLEIDLKGGREDQFISEFLRRRKRFAQKWNICDLITVHPRTLRKNDKKEYDPIDYYDLSGGSMWGNKTDNFMSNYRPFQHTKPDDPSVEIHVKKIKKHKLVGLPGVFEMEYDRFTSRYTVNGISPFDSPDNPYNAKPVPIEN